MEPMIECNDCGLSHYVVWANDGGEPPALCPRCGSNDLVYPPESEASE